MACQAQNTQSDVNVESETDETYNQPFVVNYPTPGANATESYLPYLKGKKVGLVVNATSIINKTHLVDTLLSLNIDIKTVFAPEHGFRGQEDAGAKVVDKIDEKTGLDIISLYGKNKKPQTKQLQNIDIIVFDIQDVGVRFYTYISTLHYVMEACAENNVELIVLDRPNPNGFYVDGPIMEDDFTSFVGLHPVPIIYGMTIGEYGTMIQGQSWINRANELQMKVIKCVGYNRNTTFELPVRPSPNLPTLKSILLYPSLCLFEGTTVSVGRGTEFPFEVFGHPRFVAYDFYFTPISGFGSKYPKHENKICFGQELRKRTYDQIKQQGFNLQYLYEAKKLCSNEISFFNDNNFFEKLAGTIQIREDLNNNLTPKEIKSKWKENIVLFNKMKEPYLMY